MRGSFYGAVAALLIICCAGLAAPKPAVVPGPDDWTVDVKFENPQRILLQTAGDKSPRLFWYLILTLTNNTNRDVEFYPNCELMTDTFQLIPAGKNVPDEVFEQIKTRHKTIYPFLEPLEKSGNKILQGDDNTKDIVIVWPDFDPNAKSIDLFVTGLSNETIAIEDPAAKDKDGNSVRIFLRKTLQLTYTIGGDPAFRADAKLLYNDRQWVMR